MKTFEEKWTAWLDGQLTGKELIDFEASLPDKAAAELEKRDAKKLGALLKRELGTHVIANAEFFSHQLRERIARENVEPFREQAAEVSLVDSPSTVLDRNGFARPLSRFCRFRYAGEESSRAIAIPLADPKRAR